MGRFRQKRGATSGLPVLIAQASFGHRGNSQLPLPLYLHLGSGMQRPKRRYADCTGLLFRCRFRTRLNRVSNMRSSVKCVALLCLLLTFWSAFAFAAHHHSKSTESAKCTVCVAAHSAAPKATTNLLKATFTPISTFRADPVSGKQRFMAFALSVRPPPAI